MVRLLPPLLRATSPASTATTIESPAGACPPALIVRTALADVIDTERCPFVGHTPSAGSCPALRRPTRPSCAAGVRPCRRRGAVALAVGGDRLRPGRATDARRHLRRSPTTTETRGANAPPPGSGPNARPALLVCRGLSQRDLVGRPDLRRRPPCRDHAAACCTAGPPSTLVGIRGASRVRRSRRVLQSRQCVREILTLAAGDPELPRGERFTSVAFPGTTAAVSSVPAAFMPHQVGPARIVRTDPHRDLHPLLRLLRYRSLRRSGWRTRQMLPQRVRRHPEAVPKRQRRHREGPTRTIS